MAEQGNEGPESTQVVADPGQPRDTRGQRVPIALPGTQPILHTDFYAGERSLPVDQSLYLTPFTIPQDGSFLTQCHKIFGYVDG